MTKLIKYL